MAQNQRTGEDDENNEKNSQFFFFYFSLFRQAALSFFIPYGRANSWKQRSS